MKTKKSLRVFTLISLSLMAVLLLSACNFPLFNMGSTATPESPSGEIPASPTEVPTMSSDMGSGGGGSCLVGKWQVQDYSAYFSSLNNMLPAGTDASVTNDSVTGESYFEFRADGSGTFVANQFKQSYTMTFNANGSEISIPMSVLINGTADTHYTVEGDQISFHDQNANDSTIDIEIMGNTTHLDQAMFGDPGTIKLYQYTCVDANTLNLKVIAADIDLGPLTLVRIP